MNLKNLKYRLAAMMQGRYGIDPLYKALLGLMIGLYVLNLIFPSAGLFALSMIAGGAAIFRGFSKNREKRAAENRKYLAFRDSARKKGLRLLNRAKDFRTHRYRACPNCKTVLRLNKKTGVNHVTCPVCKQPFDVKISW